MHQRIEFQSLNPIMPVDMRRRDRVASIGVGADLFMPDTAPADGGRLPAVVVAPGLGGPKEDREHSYGAFLADHRQAALVLDSFRARRAHFIGNIARAVRVTEAMLLADAFAALRWLAARPEIDPGRIAIMGFSFGGMIATLAAHKHINDLFALGEERFAGHVSSYGSTIPRLERTEATGAPVLIMVGGLDRNVDIQRSRRAAEDLRQGGAPVEFIVYDDAFHQWERKPLGKERIYFSLHDCHMHRLADDSIVDEATGIRVRGRFSRMLALAMSARWRGYHVCRNEGVLGRANRRLLTFLGQLRRLPGGRAPRMA